MSKTKPLVCWNCGHIDDDSMSMCEHDHAAEDDRIDIHIWCSDCMRQADLCQSCDKHIGKVSDENWTDDRLCQNCGDNEN